MCDVNNYKDKVHIIKNSFPIYQVKKMIGKKLIIPWNSLIISIQNRNAAKIIKTKIIESYKNDTSSNKKQKTLVLMAICNNGVLQVFKNIEIFIAINSISYKELNEGVGNNINIIIHQYPKMTKNEINKLL